MKTTFISFVGSYKAWKNSKSNLSWARHWWIFRRIWPYRSATSYQLGDREESDRETELVKFFFSSYFCFTLLFIITS